MTSESQRVTGVDHAGMGEQKTCLFPFGSAARLAAVRLNV